MKDEQRKQLEESTTFWDSDSFMAGAEAAFELATQGTRDEVTLRDAEIADVRELLAKLCAAQNDDIDAAVKTWLADLSKGPQ